MKKLFFIALAMIITASVFAQSKSAYDSTAKKDTTQKPFIAIVLTQEDYAQLQQVILQSNLPSWQSQQYIFELNKKVQYVQPAKKEEPKK